MAITILCSEICNQLAACPTSWLTCLPVLCVNSFHSAGHLTGTWDSLQQPLHLQHGTKVLFIWLWIHPAITQWWLFRACFQGNAARTTWTWIYRPRVSPQLKKVLLNQYSLCTHPRKENRAILTSSGGRQQPSFTALDQIYGEVTSNTSPNCSSISSNLTFVQQFVPLVRSWSCPYRCVCNMPQKLSSLAITSLTPALQTVLCISEAQQAISVPWTINCPLNRQFWFQIHLFLL